MLPGASSAISRVRSFAGRKHLCRARIPVLHSKCPLTPLDQDRLPFEPVYLNLLGPDDSQEPGHDDDKPERDPNLPPEATRKQLLPILRLLGCADDIPKPRKGTTNLGYTNLNQPLNRALRRESYQSDNGVSPLPPPESRGISLAGLTARYLLHKIWPDREALFEKGYPLRPTFFALGDRARKYLASRNADTTDIALWAHVVLGMSGAEATARLEWLCRKLKYRVPSFTISHTLRHLSGHNIHTVRKIAYIVDRYFTRNAEIIEQTNRPQLKVDPITKRIIFLRLFRITNYYAPTQLPLVAKIYAKHCIDPPAEISANDIIFCNHILWAIGGPPRIADPYWTSLRYIIDAQIFLLRKMFKSNPVMHLNPKGFRGIVRTRLAAPRSATERVIIAQQGSNWPPWKDVTDGYDQTHSRIESDLEEPVTGEAGRVLAEMQHAGYPLGIWEEAAMTLSGREEDGTPTVPRRTWFIAGTSTGKDNPFTRWQARLRATRTLNEAWALFLRFLRLPMYSDTERAGAVHVYQEMFERLTQARKQEALTKHLRVEEPPPQPLVGLDRYVVRKEELDEIFAPSEPKKDPADHYLRTSTTTIRGPTDLRKGPNLEDRATVSIGDTKNILPPPSDPNRGAYVPVTPPTVIELWDLMLRNGFKPSLGLTKHLIANAASITEAHTYLEEWYSYLRRRRTFKTEKGRSLWRWWADHHPKELQKLRIRQFGVPSAKLNDTKPSSDSIEASSATVELAIAYIHCLTSVTFAPRKSKNFQTHWTFSHKHLFIRIPAAINIAIGFNITALSAWSSILKALNYTHHHRGLFQADAAKHAITRLDWAGFVDGGGNRKMKYRDVNVCVMKIWKYIKHHWGYPLDSQIVYEFAIAAERGWEYEKKLESYTNDTTHGHKPMPFRTNHVIDIFETMVGIRKVMNRSFKNPGKMVTSSRINVGSGKEEEILKENDGFKEEEEEGGDDHGSVLEKLVQLSAPVIEEKSRLPPLTTPRTAHIHAYVRLLMRTGEGNFGPILRLLRWMVRYSDFLDVKNRRLPIIAIKALWDFDTALPKDLPAEKRISAWETRKEKYAEVKKLVLEGLNGWGGWPTDAEVAAYNGKNWKDLVETPVKGRDTHEDVWEEEDQGDMLEDEEVDPDDW